MPSDNELWELPGPGLHPERQDHDPTEARRGGEPIHEKGALKNGDRLVERFEIHHCIGQGGMGSVYEAFDTLRDERVAIKVLAPGLLGDKEAARHFKSEAAIATRLSHPNIVTVYDFHEVDGTYALVMELLEGRTLRDEIRSRAPSGKPFTPGEAMRFLGPVCEALEYAHRSTVHRDVKPENIWIGNDGTVKLMDFGLAKLVERGNKPLSLQTLSQLRLGSPYYTSPEQLRDAARATAASDQFAVGVIAYELLSGELPIGLAKPLRDLRPDLPYALTDTVDRALTKESDERFPSVMAFWNAFHRGCQARRSLRQFVDTKPVLRRSVIAAGAVLTVTAAANLAVEGIGRRADSIITQTREAQGAAMALRTETVALQRRADGLKRRLSEAETARNLSTTAPRAAPAQKGVAATLRDEVNASRLDRELMVAQLAWELLSPRLDTNGIPIVLSNGLEHLEDLLDDHDFAGFAAARENVHAALEHERTVLENVEALAASRIAIRDLKSAHAILKSSVSETSDSPREVRGAEAADASLPEGDNWKAALAASRASEKALFDPLRERFTKVLASHQEALADWEALFPKKLGPPPIEFLGFPAAKADAAMGFHELGRFDRAIPLLEDAVEILESWTHDVSSLHARCDEMWKKAQAEGRAFENPIGMRFVRIEDHYWSIWETRVMDFARYIHAEGEDYEAVGTRWMNPGFPIGPTHPVVFVEASAGKFFGRWIRRNFRGEPTDQVPSAVPLVETWRAMLAREPQWEESPVKWALYPDQNEIKKPRWQVQWRDPGIDSARFIKPVALGEPSATGLYDLFGNVWEWAGDPQTFEKGRVHDGRPWDALFGGGTFGHVGFDGWKPPDDETLFVGRGDAIGFRVVLYGPPLDAVLGRKSSQ